MDRWKGWLHRCLSFSRMWRDSYTVRPLHQPLMYFAYAFIHPPHISTLPFSPSHLSTSHAVHWYNLASSPYSVHLWGWKCTSDTDEGNGAYKWSEWKGRMNKRVHTCSLPSSPMCTFPFVLQHVTTSRHTNVCPSHMWPPLLHSGT